MESISQTPSDQPLSVFERLTTVMAEIAQNEAAAPEDNKPAHRAALLAAYENAHTYLLDNQDLAQQLLKSHAEPEASQITLPQARSAHQILHYIDNGLLTVSSTTREELVRRSDQLEKLQLGECSQAFSVLFASAVIVEEVVEPSNELDDEDFDVDEAIDDPHSINILDIIELLEEHTFTPEQQAFIRYGLESPSFNLKDLRKDVWEIIALSTTEYEQFEKDVYALKFETIRFLKTAGIPARWETLDKPKGNIRLRFGRDAEKPQDDSNRSGLHALYGKGFDSVPSRIRKRHKSTDSKAALNEERETDSDDASTSLEKSETVDLSVLVSGATKQQEVPRDETTEELIDDTHVLQRVHELLANAEAFPTLTSIAKLVAADIDSTHAAVWGSIKRSIDQGNLFYGQPKRGSKTLALSPQNGALETAQKSNRAKEKAKALSQVEIKVAAAVFGNLAGRHIQQGETLSALFRSSPAGLEEPQFRRLIRRLESNGLLTLDASRKYRRGRKGVIVMIAEQALKDRWHNAPQEVLDILSKIGQDLPDHIVD